MPLVCADVSPLFAARAAAEVLHLSVPSPPRLSQLVAGRARRAVGRTLFHLNLTRKLPELLNFLINYRSNQEKKSPAPPRPPALPPVQRGNLDNHNELGVERSFLRCYKTCEGRGG